jgi:acetyltransferase-like isoleucine patch superfamily enzyme
VHDGSVNTGNGQAPARSLGGLPARLFDRLWRGSRTRLIYFEAPKVASALRKRWAKFKNPKATIRFGKHVYAGPGFSLHMPDGGTFIAHDGVEFRRRFRAEVGANGRIELGAASYFTYDAVMSCDTSIRFGERVGIGQCAYIIDGVHRYRDPDLPLLAQGYDYRPLEIGDDVSVFSKVTIINSIGKKAVIGSNAVVTKPIPPFTMAGGVPAKVIEYFGPPGMEPEGWDGREQAESSEAASS